jgi:gamma-glutamyltranspeptidase
MRLSMSLPTTAAPRHRGPGGQTRTGHAHVGDTTHLDAVDREGNMVAATKRRLDWHSPVIKGCFLGTCGQMFYLNPECECPGAP